MNNTLGATYFPYKNTLCAKKANGDKINFYHETCVHFRTSLFVIAKQEYGFDHPSCAEQRSVKIHVFSRIKFFLSVIVESLRHDKERNEEQNTMGPFSWAQRF